MLPPSLTIAARVAFALGSVVHASAAAQAPPGVATHALSDGRLRGVRDSVVAMVASGRIPSMTIAVSIDGRTIWEEGIGWADRERSVAASPWLAYPLGSLSKSIAALRVMSLVSDGRLRLDAALAPLLPFPLASAGGDATTATVRHALNMSAGIPHGWLAYQRWDDGYLPSPARERGLAAIGQVVFPPGQVHEYSNFSSGLSEFVIESVTQRAYRDYMRTRVFAPLGMDSAWTGTERESERHTVASYTSRGARIDTLGWFLPAGGGGFRASARDLLRYGEFQLGTRAVVDAPVSPALLDTMHRYDGGPGGLYALGWFRGTDRLVSNGSIGGANANLTLAPRARAVVVCLLNATSPNMDADRICGRIADALDPRPAGAESESMRRYFEVWEPPYRPSDATGGVWIGAIASARGPLPVRLEFSTDSAVRIHVGTAAPVTMRGPTYNRFGRFDAGFRAILPTFESEADTTAVDAGLKLFVAGDSAVGYVLPRFGTDRGGFAVPLPIRLVRMPR